MSARTRWSLTADGFDRLLQALGPDAETSGREYENLRRALIAMFTWTGGRDPESLADTTLDRAAKRLAEGERIENLRAWTRSAARLVLQESYLTQTREHKSAQDALHTARSDESQEKDHACLESCLRGLPPESRSLLERYYQSPGGSLISGRRQLASDLGISIETLRTRALRLRRSLVQCVVRCRATEIRTDMKRGNSPLIHRGKNTST
jgi:DNA-directed RNA polymerase specialized sigma24 family protein